MKVVLTGATGLLGRALLPALQARGHSVVALSRPQWNGERDPAPVEVVGDCEAVIHLAGENVATKRWSRAHKIDLRDSRVISAANLKVGLKKSGNQPKVFISASGVGFYGDRGDEWLSESASSGADFLARLCVEWESAALAVGAKRTVMLRLGVVLAPGGGFLHQLKPMLKRFGASRLGSGRQWLSWIHIEDAVALLVRALEDENYSGPINAVAPNPVTNAEMTRALKSLWHTFSAPPVPRLVLRLVVGEMAYALLASQRARPEFMLRNHFKWKFSTFAAACEAAERGE